LPSIPLPISALDFITLQCKVIAMETNWAAENLQTIRTLMERSAIYRRALAPVMTFVGSLGAIAAIASYLLNIRSAHGFIYYWCAVCAIAASGVLLLIRRQALNSAEPFWTPPTRRVVEAMSPAFVLGGCLTGFAYFATNGPNSASLMLPPMWMAFYGCALHAGGFFMPRGVRLLGWAFVMAAAVMMALSITNLFLFFEGGHLPMGICFGGLHLAYGIYLFFTEKRRNEP
jgi:hypothetical protein